MRALAAIAVLVAGTAGCGQRPKPLTEFTAPAGDFRIALPSLPAVDVREDAAVYKVADGDSTYMIRRIACPPEFAGDESPDRLFDKFQELGVESLKGTLQGHRAVTSGGHTGREFVIHAVGKKKGQPYEMTTRIFRVGTDVYILQATTPRENAARSRAAPVLDSFTVLK